MATDSNSPIIKRIRDHTPPVVPEGKPKAPAHQPPAPVKQAGFIAAIGGLLSKKAPTHIATSAQTEDVASKVEAVAEAKSEAPDKGVELKEIAVVVKLAKGGPVAEGTLIELETLPDASDEKPVTLSGKANAKGAVLLRGDNVAVFADTPFQIRVAGVIVNPRAELEVANSRERIEAIYDEDDLGFDEDAAPAETAKEEPDEIAEEDGEAILSAAKPTSPFSDLSPASWIPIIILGVLILGGIAGLLTGSVNISNPTQSVVPNIPQQHELLPIDLPSLALYGKVAGSLHAALLLAIVLGVILNFKDAKSRGQTIDAKVSMWSLVVFIYAIPLAFAYFSNTFLPGLGWLPNQIRMLNGVVGFFGIFLALLAVILVSRHGGVDYTPLASFLITWGGITAITGNSGALKLLFDIPQAAILPFVQLKPYIQVQNYSFIEASLANYAILLSGLAVLALLEIPRLLKTTIDSNEKLWLLPRSLGAIAAYFALKLCAAKDLMGLGDANPVFLFVTAIALGYVAVAKQVAVENTSDQEETEHRTKRVWRILWDKLAVQLAFFILFFVITGTV